MIPTDAQFHANIRKTSRRVFLCAALLWSAVSCARIMAPTGGPKDTTPPQLIRTFPARGSTSFKEKVIKLVFDKRIAVNDIENKLKVMPELPKLDRKPSYAYCVRGKTLVITLRVPLQEETTYTFHFGEAIKDTTEGNIAQAPVLTFSTGASIDTMYVTGQVSHLMTQRPAPYALVALCKAGKGGINPFDYLPDYFTQADAHGKFTMAYVKKGKYYLYAGAHKNDQLRIDPSADAYGFLGMPVDLTEGPAENIHLDILKADGNAFVLKSQQLQDQYFVLRFSKPVASYQLVPTLDVERSEQASPLYSHLIEEGCAIRVYNTLGLSAEQTIQARLTARDNLGVLVQETVSIHFGDIEGPKHIPQYSFSPASGTAIHTAFVGTMTVSQPVKTVVLDHLFFVFDNQHKIPIDPEDLQWNAQRDVMTIRKKLDPGMLGASTNGIGVYGEAVGPVLHIGEGAFTTVEGDTNVAMQYAYRWLNPKGLGTIRGTITTEAPGFIIQLLDSEYNVVDEIRNERHYQFKRVSPGRYRLRVLILQAEDAEWRPGNIRELREPDRVVCYANEIGVIANWEVEGIDLTF